MSTKRPTPQKKTRMANPPNEAGVVERENQQRQAEFNRFAKAILNDIGGLPNFRGWLTDAKREWKTRLSEAGIRLITIPNEEFPSDFERHVAMDCGYALRLGVLVRRENDAQKLIEAMPCDNESHFRWFSLFRGPEIEENEGMTEFQKSFALEDEKIRREILSAKMPGDQGWTDSHKKTVMRSYRLQLEVLASIATHWWDAYKKTHDLAGAGGAARSGNNSPNPPTRIHGWKPWKQKVYWHFHPDKMRQEPSKLRDAYQSFYRKNVSQIRKDLGEGAEIDKFVPVMEKAKVIQWARGGMKGKPSPLWIPLPKPTQEKSSSRRKK